jgi:hypothetical protein
MPTLTILSLNAGDNQQDIRNKINSNFDSVVQNGGGPQGQQGEQGLQGSIGSAGAKGDPGQQGTRGNKWFVQASQPLGGLVDPVLDGDYWVNTISDNEIFEYGPAGWVTTGSDLQSTELFTTLVGISGPVGTKNAIVLNTSFPEVNTFVLSDAVSLAPTANPTYSKFLIATNSSSDYPILEFAKTNASGIGTPVDYNRHPQFRWLSPSGSNYNLLFSVPQDQLEIKSGSSLVVRSTASSLLLSANTSLSLTAGTTMSVSSGGQMSFNSGSSTMLFTSQRFNLTSSALNITVPLSINGTSPGYIMSFTNQSSSGGGLSVSLSTALSSQFLANFVAAGTSRFNVRANGKVFMNQTGTATTTITGTYDALVSVLGLSTYFWYLGTNKITTGNTVITNLNVPSDYRGISFPIGSATNSWSAYLDNNESIQFRVISSSNSNKIQVISYDTGAGPTGAISLLGTSGAQFIDFTIIRKSSQSDYNIYYSTCEGLCGIMV